jgi:hypothetical protein
MASSTYTPIDFFEHAKHIGRPQTNFYFSPLSLNRKRGGPKKNLVDVSPITVSSLNVFT